MPRNSWKYQREPLNIPYIFELVIFRSNRNIKSMKQSYMIIRIPIPQIGTRPNIYPAAVNIDFRGFILTMNNGIGLFRKSLKGKLCNYIRGRLCKWVFIFTKGAPGHIIQFECNMGTYTIFYIGSKNNLVPIYNMECLAIFV